MGEIPEPWLLSIRTATPVTITARDPWVEPTDAIRFDRLAKRLEDGYPSAPLRKSIVGRARTEPRATSLLQIVDRQFRRWELLREERRASAKPVHWPIITIAREFGARGEALGRTLAEGIDFSFWDQELVHAMAEESGANEAFLATLDEYRRNVIEDSVDGALMGGKYMNSAYIRRLVKLVHTIATQGSSVVVGRGAHYVVAPDEALRVRVVCSLEERVRRHSEREGTSLDAARKILDREDAARARFLRHNYGSDGTNPADYDLIVNTGSIPLERAAAPILAAYEAKFARRPEEAQTEPLRS